MPRPHQIQEALRVMTLGYRKQRPETWEPTTDRVAAYALSLAWPKDAVMRVTLGAACGGSGAALAHALYYFDCQGWVSLGAVAVFVHDADALRGYAVRDVGQPVGLRDILNIAQVLAALDGCNIGDDGQRARVHIEREFLVSLL